MHERVAYSNFRTHKPTAYLKKAARINPELIYKEKTNIDSES